ncbi:NRAMP family divalent metal transporter [Croceimicrobium sp.]|uniref:NRAMP family divalent metal transporter n=1 Tax=Croceimicrobium sp. TaxID=2828340 RepID=UPI003BADA476
MKAQSLRIFLKTLGPGLLFASTAIGVSHLVQSTRAGADYGFALLWAVILANVLKFPFFEYGSRYAASAQQSLIDGYRDLGKGMLLLYGLITLGTMFFVTAAVGAVTAGFLHQLFGLQGIISIKVTTFLLFATCMLILLIGHYKALDRLIKIVGSILLTSTLLAFFSTLGRGPAADPFQWFDASILEISNPSFPFLIALMGWMPTAVDLSAWNSLWTLARRKESGYQSSLKEVLREFNIGYWISALLAPCFMLLGAYLVFGTDKVLAQGSAAFAGDIINLYTESIGDWSRWVISAAAFSIMFGTCIAVFDGYARSAQRVWQLVRPQNSKGEESSGNSTFQIVLIVVGLGALLVINQFGNSLRSLVDLATAISFLVAPIIAFANFKLVMGLRPEDRPGLAMRWLSRLGLVFLSGFSLVYLYALIF